MLKQYYRANHLSGSCWWFWHSCSHLMAKVTSLPETWFVSFYVLTSQVSTFSHFISFRESERGGCCSLIHGHISLASAIQPAEPLVFLLYHSCPLNFLCLIALSSHLVKGGQPKTVLTQAPSDRWGQRGLRCHWLTAGESAMRIGGCQGTGMKTCVRRRWCWWRSCASTRGVTARTNAARSSSSWGGATGRLIQVTHTPGASYKQWFNKRWM